MRIVGGKLAGRDLLGPSDFRVRPTAEHAFTHKVPVGAASMAFEECAVTIYRR